MRDFVKHEAVEESTLDIEWRVLDKHSSLLSGNTYL